MANPSLHPENRSPLRVQRPPVKPLLIYDGECNFCMYWVRRWQRITGDHVDYLPLQDPSVRERFPEIQRDSLERAVHWIDTDGEVACGADAVFRSLSCNPAWGWPLALYRRWPRVAASCDWAYRLVAERRTTFSFLTRLLWGVHSEPSEYGTVCRLFLGCLGAVYLFAFVSLWTQLDGLFGHQGILPASQYMDAARQYFDQEQVGLDRYRLLPTWCWLSSSNGFLHAICGVGTAASLLLMAGVAPSWCAALLWSLYLSLVSIGREFLSFQWDALLLEAGFLAIFLAPLPLRPKPSDWAGAPRIILLLVRLLLFRLMFESGCVKLLSGDPSWRNLTALTFHYETQPLPTWAAWYAHHWPLLFQQASVVAMFVIELALPFFILAPRRPRIQAAAGFAVLQIWILITGNYGFFNYLTMVLCLVLLDDAALRHYNPIARLRRRRPGRAPAVLDLSGQERVTQNASWKTGSVWPRAITVPLAILVVALSVHQVCGMFGWQGKALAPMVAMMGWLAPFRSLNSYGLFAVMTTTRPEIIVEGSNDGQTWVAYEFTYKPGDLNRPPSFVAPHQPRLDWQMWFAALGTYRQNPWFVQFCFRLLEGDPPVLGLLKRNPFPNAPPRFVRAVLYTYRFTSSREKRAEKRWWTRHDEGIYLPPISQPARRPIAVDLQ